jgi:GUN4-like
LTVLFNVKTADLKRICGTDKDYYREILPPISRLLPALGVLIDKRSKAKSAKGSDVWKFEIVFWSKDRAENKRRFEAEWEKKKNDGAFPANNSTKQTLTATPVQNSSIDNPPIPISILPIQSPTPQIDWLTERKTFLKDDAVPLESEKEVDYRNLRDLLMTGKWREADKETLTLMLKAANRESQGWLDSDSLKKFPCKDLKTIDRLWVIASNGHFGISVQTKIWVACCSPIAYSDDWKTFCDRLGWYKNGNPLKFSDLKLALDLSPKGELPSWVLPGENAGDLIHGEVFFSRAKTCEL